MPEWYSQDGLTDRQRLFCKEYLRDGIAWKAAKRAGYSGNENTLAVTAGRLLRNKKIIKALRLHQDAGGGAPVETETTEYELPRPQAGPQERFADCVADIAIF